MMKIVMFCMLFDAGIVPTYLIVRKTGLINTLWAMIVPTLVSAYNLVIMKAFFEGLPEELFEAARIDGANEFRILWHLILPMALPIILTIGMYYAVDHWNCYLLSIYYITKDQLKPLQVILRRLLDAGVQCGVVSNKQDDLARAIVEHHFPGVFTRVRGAVAGCPVKPAPDGVQALMAAMGADPARTLYVGDSNVDIYTAHNAKLPGCGAVWGFRGRDELLAAGADVLADTPEDLANVVLG